MEAKVLLRKIALRNDPSGKYLPLLDSIKLRIPKKIKSYEKACESWQMSHTPSADGCVLGKGLGREGSEHTHDRARAQREGGRQIDR